MSQRRAVITVAPDLHKTLRHQAVDEGVPLGELVDRLLRASVLVEPATVMPTSTDRSEGPS
jgi:hypothetical protein